MLTHLELCKLFSVQRSLKNCWFSAKGIIIDGGVFLLTVKSCSTLKEVRGYTEEKGETISPSVHQFLSNRLLCQCECTPVGTTAAANGHPLVSLLGKVGIVSISNFTLSCCLFLRWLSYCCSLEKEIEKEKCATSPQVHVVVFVSKPILFLNKTVFAVIANKNWNLSDICCNNLKIVMYIYTTDLHLDT